MKHSSLNLNKFSDYIRDHGIDAAMAKYHMSRNTVKKICKNNDIPIPKKGRPLKRISDEQKQWVDHYRALFNLGYKKMSRVSFRYNMNISEWNMRKYYEENDLYIFMHEFKPDPKEEHSNRFTAKFAGQSWHTDLHYLKIQSNEEKQKYLIAFIDDRTRKILYYEVLNDKCGLTVSNSLIKALQSSPPPRFIIIDNGTEFIGENFQRILKDYGIQVHRIHAYTPQENGKIERWWKTIEHSATSPLVEPYLSYIINEYNTKWEHCSLKELTGQPMTPEEAWCKMIHWENQPFESLGYEYNNEMYSYEVIDE